MSRTITRNKASNSFLEEQIRINITSGINWTKTVVASAILCTVLSFSVMAQDNPNKPLDEESVSALVEELTNGLADFIEDEARVTAITEKWDERENLAGKTRTQRYSACSLRTLNRSFATPKQKKYLGRVERRKRNLYNDGKSNLKTENNGKNKTRRTV